MAQTLTDNLTFRFPEAKPPGQTDKDRIAHLEQDVANLKKILNNWVNVQLRPVIGVGGILKPSKVYSSIDPTTWIEFPGAGGIKIFQNNAEKAGWPV